MFDAPTNTKHLTGLTMELKSSQDIRLEFYVPMIRCCQPNPTKPPALIENIFG